MPSGKKSYEIERVYKKLVVLVGVGGVLINGRNIKVVWDDRKSELESDSGCTPYELVVLWAIHLMVIISNVFF